MQISAKAIASLQCVQPDGLGIEVAFAGGACPRPDGLAIEVHFGGEETLARGLIAGPLGQPRGLAHPVVRALTGLAGPLGHPRGLARTGLPLRGRLFGPLGRVAALVEPRDVASATIALGGPLGRGMARITVRRYQAAPPPEQTLAPARLLCDPLPLRRALVLEQYREDVLLPWVYGRVTLSPVPLDADGLEYLVADHPIVGVSSVKVGGLAITGWQLTQALDVTGHPVATLRLTRAPKSGESLAVSLIGRRHPDTGAVLEHPADIAEDLLRAGGWSVPPEAFDALRDAFPGLALGGVIQESTTLRASLNAVLTPLGADWSAAPLRAWITSAEETALTTLPSALIDDASAESTHADLATRLVVSFGHDWSANQPRASLTLEAPGAVEQFGELESSLSLPWVRTARDALAIATAALQARARPTWSISLAVAPTLEVRAGDPLALAHPWIPHGVARVTRVTRTQERHSLTLTRPAGPLPRVTLARRGALIEPAGTDPLSVVYRDGVATFTILTELGEPLAGASVSLDGAETRVTDRLGQVQFQTTRGDHTLLVVATGYAPFELEVVV